MAEVVWTEQALDDLEAACRYIARNSTRYATLFAQRMFDATDDLGLFPRSGRLVPEARSRELRELIVQGYRLIYRLRAHRVEIVALHHGARRLRPQDLD